MAAMTPSERILKAVHMAIDADRTMLDAVNLEDAHQVTFRVKPRGREVRVSIAVETRERDV